MSVPGPISSLKIYVSDASAFFLAKIFEVSAFALKRSNIDIILENLMLVAKLFLLISDGSILAVSIVSTFVCVSNSFTMCSIVDGGYKQSSSGKAIREHLASLAPWFLDLEAPLKSTLMWII